MINAVLTWSSWVSLWSSESRCNVYEARKKRNLFTCFSGVANLRLNLCTNESVSWCLRTFSFRNLVNENSLSKLFSREYTFCMFLTGFSFNLTWKDLIPCGFFLVWYVCYLTRVEADFWFWRAHSTLTASWSLQKQNLRCFFLDSSHLFAQTSDRI